MLILDSDYPIDQVVGRWSYSITVGPHGYHDQSIPHQHGTSFLPISQYSTSPSFSTVYDDNTSPFVNGVILYDTAVYVTSTSIGYRITNNTSNTATFYFRTAGLQLPSTDRNESSTSQYQSMTFNSDLNYQKLYMEGSVNVSSQSSSVINHGLGFVPTFIVWRTSFFGLMRSSYASTGGVYGNATRANSSSLFLVNDSFSGSDTFYYRIYNNA